MATQVVRLGNKFPRTDIRKKGWIKKEYNDEGDWHWKITASGKKALSKKK